MMKEKEWLKEELVKLKKETDERNKHGSNYTDEQLVVRRMCDLADQLDELEITEEQAWNKIAESYPADAKSLAVAFEHFYYEGFAKKPVIPQFVADYIELNKGWSEDRQEYKEDYDSGLWFALGGDIYGMPNSVSDWLFNEEKVETFARAWLDGYEVKKEKKYRVTFNLTEWNDEASELEEYSVFLALDVASDETLIITSRDGIGDYRTDLTEQEIKAIDERYWAFAQEVQE